MSHLGCRRRPWPGARHCRGSPLKHIAVYIRQILNERGKKNRSLSQTTVVLAGRHGTVRWAMTEDSGVCWFGQLSSVQWLPASSLPGSYILIESRCT